MKRTGASPRRFGGRRLMLVALALLVLAAITLAGHGQNVHSPASAAPGATIHVTAGNLRQGDYSLTLYGRDPAAAGHVCQARITGADNPLSAIDFTARIPRRLPCYSAATAIRAGSIPVTPGRYALIISVPRGTTGFDSGHAYISRVLRIT
jgi:hypothetical protein